MASAMLHPHARRHEHHLPLPDPPVLATSSTVSFIVVVWCWRRGEGRGREGGSCLALALQRGAAPCLRYSTAQQGQHHTIDTHCIDIMADEYSIGQSDPCCCSGGCRPGLTPLRGTPTRCRSREWQSGCQLYSSSSSSSTAAAAAATNEEEARRIRRMCVHAQRSMPRWLDRADELHPALVASRSARTHRSRQPPQPGTPKEHQKGISLYRDGRRWVFP